MPYSTRRVLPSPPRFVTLSRAPRPSAPAASSPPPHNHHPSTPEDNVEFNSPKELAGLSDNPSTPPEDNVGFNSSHELADLSDSPSTPPEDNVEFDSLSELAFHSDTYSSCSCDSVDAMEQIRIALAREKRKSEKRVHKAESSIRPIPVQQDVRIRVENQHKAESSVRPIPVQQDVRIRVENHEKRAEEFEADFHKMAMKIHRFPTSLKASGMDYSRPMVVAIGPYNHGLNGLVEMEKVKIVAAHHFIRDSGHSLTDIYQAVYNIADSAHILYEEGGILMNKDDFVGMLLCDACFLLQYIRLHTAPSEVDVSLACCFNANQACINVDILILDNQLPWFVVKTLMNFMPVAVDKFCARMGGYFQIRKHLKCQPFVMDDSYEPPHLLAILRSCVIGRNTGGETLPVGLESMSTIPSAMELEEIGIKLTTSKTAKFMDMGVKKTTLFSKLYLAPLSLDSTRAAWLVNMAAFEVCTSSFWIEGENIVVCSYLCLLAMLINREEDVHELRRKRIFQGELSDMATLEFFQKVTRFMYGGPLYYRIMADIESYKLKRWLWIKVHEFLYKNFKTIITVFSVVGVLAGIFKTLMSLDKHH